MIYLKLIVILLCLILIKILLKKQYTIDNFSPSFCKNNNSVLRTDKLHYNVCDNKILLKKMNNMNNTEETPLDTSSSSATPIDTSSSSATPLDTTEETPIGSSSSSSG